MAKSNPIDSGIAHTSDATFRAWWAEFRAMLAEVGLVQTSDTGQVDPATMTRPGMSMDAGYETWRFNDSLQSTAPIFIKFFPGTGAGVSTPRIRFQVGSGTNGAGTFIGAFTNIFGGVGASSNQPPGASAYGSKACCVPGIFWIVFKNKGWPTGSSAAAFSVERTVNNSGEPTAFGCIVKVRDTSTLSSSFLAQGLRFGSTPAVSAAVAATNICLIPMGITDTKVNSAGGPGLDPQIFLHWYAMPKQQPTLGLVTYPGGEIADYVEFDLALVGTTPRHYVTLNQASFGAAGTGLNSSAVAAVWED